MHSTSGCYVPGGMQAAMPKPGVHQQGRDHLRALSLIELAGAAETLHLDHRWRPRGSHAAQGEQMYGHDQKSRKRLTPCNLQAGGVSGIASWQEDSRYGDGFL